VLRHSIKPSLHVCSMVHGGIPAAHVPDSHFSAPLQNTPSEHGVPSGCFTSVGQATDVPLQVSATSQALTAARHTVPLGCF
jgi:hypothetical protein